MKAKLTRIELINKFIRMVNEQIGLMGDIESLWDKWELAQLEKLIDGLKELKVNQRNRP